MLNHYRVRRALWSLGLLASGVVATGLSYVLRPEKFKAMTSGASLWLMERWTEFSAATIQMTSAAVNAIRDVGSPALLYISPLLLLGGLILLLATFWPSRKSRSTRSTRVGSDISPAESERRTFGSP